MEAAIILVFVMGYLAITLEHSIKIDKLIPALVMMAICWALIALGLEEFPQWFDSSKHMLLENFGGLASDDKMHLMEETLLHHLGKTSEILVFLLGAMTIVEIIDYFDGFSTIKGFIRTKKKSKILWIFAILAFILSAIIDNLTATIVLVSILQKIVKDRDSRIWFAGLIIIAANAGGAWSPIGDVTTTMLWIGKKVTTGHLIGYLLLPSFICMAVPTIIASYLPAFKGELDGEEVDVKTKSRFSATMLYLGLSAIVFVPIFKTITHLPPYVGMMLSLGVVATFAEIYSSSKFSLSIHGSEESDAHAHHSPVHHSLSKIELPSILFFLGILMAVAALESLGILFGFANTLQETMPRLGTELHTGEGVSDLVVLLLGVGSAVIDNVPLVAASLGMFHEPIDDELWHFIAYSAGTGGSMLIIGSAAGVVAMGMLKIDFFWYLKKIAWLAFIGFIVGAAAFMFTRTLF
ncbi:MAG: sodium:proton antiporter NhaD [Flaviramulus sp.]|nr:sodium:proton antiporter NhaD [Flaviramulus sp.]NNC50967.1 sodium:proton antiporter NhaD [Flaviramulus sp.]